MAEPKGTAFFQIEVTGIRDIKGRFASMRDRGAVAYSRGLVRDAGKVLVASLREKAPVGRHYTFEGVEYDPPKRLRDSFFYRTYVRGKTIRLSVYSKAGAVLRYVILGTRPHKRHGKGGERGGRLIVPKKPGGKLAFYWARKKKSVIVSSVRHPGTLPNPFHERAYRKAGPKIEELQRKAARRIARALLWEFPPAPFVVM